MLMLCERAPFWRCDMAPFCILTIFYMHTFGNPHRIRYVQFKSIAIDWKYYTTYTFMHTGRRYADFLSHIFTITLFYFLNSIHINANSTQYFMTFSPYLSCSILVGWKYYAIAQAHYDSVLLCRMLDVNIVYIYVQANAMTKPLRYDCEWWLKLYRSLLFENVVLAAIRSPTFGILEWKKSRIKSVRCHDGENIVQYSIFICSLWSSRNMHHFRLFRNFIDEFF